jgi:peptidoglycan/xylan/chitin deacetylase (PgdA/CDA1 family)
VTWVVLMQRAVACSFLSLVLAVTGCSLAPPASPSSAPEPTPSAAVSSKPISFPTPKPTAAGTPTATPRPTPVRTATPKPTPRPTATLRPADSPTPSPASRLIRHGSRDVPRIALTFDMGGRVGDALKIMDWLVDRDIHATTFMTGAMADNKNTDAGRNVLASIDAHPALFTLGNHSYTHTDFRTLSRSQILSEMRRTEAAIAPYCSQDLRPYFRPPNGGYDSEVLAAVGAAGYSRTVTWDIDTIDWRPVANDPPGPTADQIVAKVLGNAQNGSIVLMHLGGYHTYEALPRIVAGLLAAGYDLVTLGEMLGA